MSRRIFLASLTVIVILCAVGFFIYTLTRALWYNPETESTLSETGVSTTTKEVAVLPEQRPLSIRIPALSLEADIQEVGITPKGNMAVPTNFTDVGWYKYGPTPGSPGKAVIAGHVNNGLGMRGVFENLHTLEKGDVIFVEQEDGSEVQFEVHDKQWYAYNAAPSDLVFAYADTVALNLITCGGTWIPSLKTYDQRLVVFAHLR